MKFASTRLIATDIKIMVSFYEMVTGCSAEWLAPVFAKIVTPGANLAIGAAETVTLWKENSAEPGANRTERQGYAGARVENDAMGQQDVPVSRPRRHGGIALHAADRAGRTPPRGAIGRGSRPPRTHSQWRVCGTGFSVRVH